MDFGTVLADRYRLDRLIGAGGMGQVWQARDLKLERDLQLTRDVAIKLMHPNLASDDMLKRFKREVVIAGSLNHPQIMTVHDADWYEGQLFIVMELIRGRDLGKILAEQPTGLPVGRTVDLARQLAAGLSAVHEHGIVHRDLKPANLLVQVGDLLKIGDFGIARDNNSVMSTLTPLGVIIGTPPYIAPERWRSTGPDERSSDLYSMGCILYQMLTGKTPFAAATSTVDLMRMHQLEVPTAPRVRNRDIPDSLNALVLRLLAKDPRQRPADAGEVVGRLGEIKDALVRAGGGHKADNGGAQAAEAEPAAAQAARDRAAGDRAARDRAARDKAAGDKAARDKAARDKAAGAKAAGAHAGGAKAPARVTAPVACLSLSKDHRHVFVLAGPRRLRNRSYWPRPGWSSWRDLPLPPGNASVIAAHAYGDHQKVAVASKGNVYHLWRIGNPGVWSNWLVMTALDSPVIDLAFAPVAAGHWEVLALDESGMIHLRTWRGDTDPAAGWTQWSDLPAPEGKPVTAIAASCTTRQYLDMPTGHRQDMVAVVDGAVWHKRREGEPKSMPGWSAWQSLGDAGSRIVDAACSSLRLGHVEVFAADDTGRIRSREYMDSAGWSGWRDVPAPEGQRVTAIASTSHPFSPHQKLAAVTWSGKVYHAWSGMGPDENSRWSPWRDMPDPK